MPAFIYLASQSPRRSQLLDQLGVRHEILVPDADEAEAAEALEAQLPGESPSAYVQRVTGLKLDAAVQRLISRGLPEAPILCADTTVARGRVIYGKPVDAPDAVRWLTELSRPNPPRADRRSAASARAPCYGAVAVARHLCRDVANANRRLRRHRRAAGQGWRLRRARARRCAHPPHQRQLLGHHGTAFV